jgi:hypothetical protein
MLLILDWNAYEIVLRKIISEVILSIFVRFTSRMVLKLYVVSDGPPSLSVRQALALLEIPFQQVDVDFGKGEHMTAEYALVSLINIILIRTLCVA